MTRAATTWRAMLTLVGAMSLGAPARAESPAWDAGPVCATHADCPCGQYCTFNYCNWTPPSAPAACANDGDCAPTCTGMRCVASRCVTAPDATVSTDATADRRVDVQPPPGDTAADPPADGAGFAPVDRPPPDVAPEPPVDAPRPQPDAPRPQPDVTGVTDVGAQDDAGLVDDAGPDGGTLRRGGCYCATPAARVRDGHGALALAALAAMITRRRRRR